MSITRQWSSIFFFILFTFSLQAEQTPSEFITIADNKIIHDNIVLKLVQDSRGYIWIGTPGGALRYDGYNFKRYQSKADNKFTLSGNFIRDILILHNGDIAFLSDPGGLSILHIETEKVTRFNIHPVLKQFQEYKSFRALAQTPNGDIWLGGLDGLIKISANLEQAKIFQKTVKKKSIGHIRSLLVNSEQLYIGSDTGLYKFNNSPRGIEQVLLPTGEDPPLINRLLQTDDGTIWAGGNTYIYYSRPIDVGFNIIQDIASKTNSDPRVNAMLQVDKSSIWLARLGKVQVIDIKNYKFLPDLKMNKKNDFELALNDIRSLIKDDSGQIWLGGYGDGLQRYLGQTAVSAIRSQKKSDFSLTHPSVSAIHERQNGDILFGSKGGGIDVFSSDVRFVKNIKPDKTIDNQLTTGFIRAITEQKDGRIWVGESPSHLYYSDDNLKTFISVGEKDGYWGSKLRRMYVDSQNRLWIATADGAAVWDNQSQNFHRLTVKKSDLFLSGPVNAIVEDNQKRIWLGTNSSGLMIADPINYEAYQPPLFSEDNFIPQNILGMLFDSQGRLWFDSPQGLHFFSDLTDDVLSIHKVSLNGNLNYKGFGANLLEDNQGRIWSHRYIYDPSNDSFYQLTPSDGIKIGTGWFRSYLKTKKGQMFFGGSSGVVSIWPDKLKKWDYMPDIVATDIRIDNKAQAVEFIIKNQLTIQPENRGFSIEFSSLDYSEPNKNSYRYKLIGFDDVWQEVNAKQRSITYTNLWPGKYTFIAQGSNRMGAFSPNTLNINVLVKPKYWQTIWFLVLIIVVIVGSGYLLVLFRTRQVKRNAKRLKKLVAEKTKQLKISQRKLLEEEKMSALGMMTIGIAHEMNTPIGIGITGISCLSEHLLDVENQLNKGALTSQELQYFFEQAKTCSSLIESNLDKTAKLVMLFKRLSTHEESYPIHNIDFSQWLDMQLKTFNKQLFKHNIEIDVPKNTNIRIRELALQDIIYELISNILIHASSNGEIITINVKLEIVDEKVRLIVSDNGQGILAENVDHIFNPFVTSKRGSDCKGLGLYLCYNLATNILKGEIKLDKDQKDITKFEITFPLEK